MMGISIKAPGPPPGNLPPWEGDNGPPGIFLIVKEPVSSPAISSAVRPFP